MIIAGVTCYANRWPRPRTSLALEWISLHKGLWRATARPASNDSYESIIEIWDSEAVLNTLWTALKTNLGALSVTLDAEEQLFFGADVQGVTSVTVMEYGNIREAGSFKMFSLPLTLKALNPSFTGDGADWPETIWTQGGWTSGSSFEVSKLVSQNNALVYQDKHETEGVWSGEFLFYTEGIQMMRRKIATLRGAQTTFPDIGVSNPFGTNLPGFDGSYVRVIEFEDLGRVNYKLWRCRIKLAFDGNAS